jgi:hypothetical protein
MWKPTGFPHLVHPLYVYTLQVVKGFPCPIYSTLSTVPRRRCTRETWVHGKWFYIPLHDHFRMVSLAHRRFGTARIINAGFHTARMFDTCSHTARILTTVSSAPRISVNSFHTARILTRGF